MVLEQKPPPEPKLGRVEVQQWPTLGREPLF